MKVDVVLLGARVYEKEGKKNTRLVFVPVGKDNLVVNSKQVGYSDLAEYYDSDILKKIPTECIFQRVTGLFENKPYVGNPFKSKSMLVGIEYEGKIYNFI